MSKQSKSFSSLAERIPGKDLPLEHIVFLGGATCGIALGAFGAIGNIAMGLPTIAIIAPLLNLVIDVIGILYSLATKKWRGPAVCVFSLAAFVLFPSLWFSTGGTMSSSLPLIIGLGVVLALVFRGRTRLVLFFSTLLVYSTFIVVELYYPNIFIPYPNREAWYFDVLIGFVLSFLTSGGLAYFTLLRYNDAKRKAEALVQQLEEISVVDPLTGVFNRRHLMVRIDEEMRKAFDEATPLTLCILDIDYFKNVNDNYGHVYGDEVLVKLSQTISGSLNESAIFGRYGGEEFVAVFPNNSLPMALESINKFYDALANINWSHGKPVTISCGVSSYTKGISYSDFLRNADTNLYKAKSNGRNRVEH